MDTIIGNPDRLWLLAMVFVTALLGAVMAWRRRRVQRRLGQRWIGVGAVTQAPWLRTALLCATFFFLTLSLLDMRWGKVRHEVPQKGIEVLFALDVSRSMLADDVSPSRLDRAKQQIRDLMNEMAGDRVGLIAFAGESKLLIPLTKHYDDFQSTLDGVGPHTVRRGGSRLGDAIDLANRSFMQHTNQHRVLVVLTDGEDQESSPVEVAERVHRESGMRIFTVGLGDWKTGARVPGREDNYGRRRETFLQYEGETVWSKLDGATLKSVALATSGAYIPAETKYVDMAQIYRRYIAPIEKTEFERAEVDAYEARFQWFALPAFVCLALEWIWTTSSRRTATGNRNPSGTAAAVLIGFLVSISGSAGYAQTVDSDQEISAEDAQAINQANQMVRDGKLQEALAHYDALPADSVLDAQRAYNRGVALHRAGKIQEAASQFRNASNAGQTELATSARYNLGNCLVELADAQLEQNPESAKTLLRQAITTYRDALRRDPQREDARANIELAYRKWKQLQQDEESEDDAPSPSESSDPASESGEPDESGDSQSSPSNSQESESSADQDSSPPQPSSGESNPTEPDDSRSTPSSADQEEASSANDATSNADPGSDESDDSQEAENSSESSRSSQPPGPSPKEDSASQGGEAEDSEQETTDSKSDASAQDSTERSGEQNGSAESQQRSRESRNSPPQSSTSDESSEDDSDRSSDSTDPNQGGDASPSTSQPGSSETGTDPANDEASTPAGESEDGGKQDSGNLSGDLSSANPDVSTQRNSAEGKPVNPAMTREEAMKMLQAIRDREMQRRRELQRRARSRRVPVERDW